MAQVVIVTNEHPTELSAKIVGKKVGEALEAQGHSVTIAQMPSAISLFKKVDLVSRGAMNQNQISQKIPDIERQKFLLQVYGAFPKAIIISFHNSPPKSALEYQEHTLRKKPSKQARSLAQNNPVSFTPNRAFPRLIAVEIPAKYKLMPEQWRTRVKAVAKQTGIKKSIQLESRVDLKRSRNAGLVEGEMVSRVLRLVARRIGHFEARQKKARKKAKKQVKRRKK